MIHKIEVRKVSSEIIEYQSKVIVMMFFQVELANLILSECFIFPHYIYKLIFLNC